MKKILLIIFVLFCHCGYAQLVVNNIRIDKADSQGKVSPRLRNMNILTPVAPDYYTAGFGFFCKQELKLEKVKVPLKIRVGNPEFCNYLESKSNTPLFQK